MGLRKVKPNAAGSRAITYPDFAELTTNKPLKSLTRALRTHSGRDQSGTISIRHRGGGVRRRFRIISTLEQLAGHTGSVQTIEYDPNRSARIALIKALNGKMIYILAPDGLQVGHTIEFNEKAEISIGNRMSLQAIPTGIEIHSVELFPQGGVRIAQSAGASAVIVSKEGDYAHVRLPSGEIRKIQLRSNASIGKIGNIAHSTVRIGKAGRMRWMGRRPTVRGKAMYPAAHPHGGGEGNSPIGLKHPKTPWGKPALGFKTRRRNPLAKLIVQKRKRK